ncbi:segregation and condensation protein A [Flocculibacter collagenilyticus]|uniref:segregation and condensation protein A n=1 Tax=Flocculibacter collagenilyticus TaxID=2744479 RepID=UPI0018F6E6DE|nr:ScpA family protein [Flocculibacter collagenilyticus]
MTKQQVTSKQAEVKDNFTDITVQQPLPLAFVRGEVVVEQPEDLYIPPEALEVFLDAFEGPLDFLLYLIKKQKFDIIDLPIQEITLQYMEYVELMKDLKLELAAEYLVMAAILAEIKSRLLLPVHAHPSDEFDDPRAELIKRLQEYEKYKHSAQELDLLPRESRDFYLANVDVAEGCSPTIILPNVALQDLAIAMQQVLKRASAFSHHHIEKEALSTRERMSAILAYLNGTDGFVPFEALFTVEEGKQGVVVTFLAVLELIKESYIDIVQTAPFTQINVKARHFQA